MPTESERSDGRALAMLADVAVPAQRDVGAAATVADAVLARVVRRVLHGTGALDELRDEAVAALSTLMPIDVLAVFSVPTDAALRPLLATWWAADGRADPASDWVDLAEEALSSGVVRWGTEGEHEAAVVLQGAGRPAAVVVLARTRGGPLSEAELGLVRDACHTAVGLLRLREVREEASFYRRLTGGVQQLLVQGAEAQSAREAGELLARSTARVFEVDRGGVYLVDGEGTIVETATFGIPADQAQAFRRSLVGKAASGSPIWRRVTTSGEPLLVEELQDSPVRPGGFVELMKLRSWVAIPLLCGGHPLGLMISGDTEAGRRWLARDMAAAVQLAGSGALVAESVRRRAAERARLSELAHQASHDDLTGLANRSELMRRLDAVFERSPGRRRAALLFVDLDDFKRVNDTLGHQCGDALLRHVAERLARQVRGRDLLVRLGGDEFAVLLHDVDAGAAHAVAQRLTQAMRHPFDVDGRLLRIRPSIGIALCPDDAQDASALMRHADTAMYVAKRGRRDPVVYAPAHDVPATKTPAGRAARRP